MNKKSMQESAAIREEIQNCDWYHSIDLGNGLVLLKGTTSIFGDP